jgi:hypothetical protein
MEIKGKIGILGSFVKVVYTFIFFTSVDFALSELEETGYT